MTSTNSRETCAQPASAGSRPPATGTPLAAANAAIAANDRVCVRQSATLVSEALPTRRGGPFAPSVLI